MAEGKREFDSLLTRALEDESQHEWSNAATSYAAALDSAHTKSPLTIGSVHEMLGHALYRSAFQADNPEASHKCLKRSEIEYMRAKRFYSECDEREKDPRNNRCDAMAAMSAYWRAPNCAERKLQAARASSLAIQALEGFKSAGNRPEFGTTYNQLSYGLAFSAMLAEDSKTREKLFKQAWDFGEYAIECLSERGNTCDLATAYVRTSAYIKIFLVSFLAAREGQDLDRRAYRYWLKARELSEETALIDTSITYMAWGLPGALDSKQTHEIVDRALEYSRASKDHLAIATCLDWKAARNYWTLLEAEDSNEAQLAAKEALRFSLDARKEYLTIGVKQWPMSWMYSCFSPEFGHFACMALQERDPKRKKELAEKAFEAAPDFHKWVESSGFPSDREAENYALGELQTIIARAEPNPEKKKQLLERALDNKKKALALVLSMNPVAADLNIDEISVADTEFEIALLTPDSESGLRMMREALDRSKKALTVLASWMSFPQNQEPRGYALVAGFQLHYSTQMAQLHQRSGDREDLESAIDSYLTTAEYFESAFEPSRSAESYWDAARAYDSIGEHLKASKRFDEAAERYRNASEKIRSLSQLYQDQFLYMKAWSEIEKARYNHARQEPASSQEHFNKAARLHESTMKWSFLSTNYQAWAEIENAEDLSQREGTKEAIEAFKEAARLFKHSRIRMQEQLPKIDIDDERQMVERLIDAGDNRQELCNARIALEEAKLLDKEGNPGSASEKYGQAADMFSKIRQRLASEQDRREIELIITLSKAWEVMAKAEADASPDEYAKAARLFQAVKDLGSGEKAKALAMGHSRFCKALEAGTHFADTRDPALHASAIKYLDSAASHYARAGAESASEYSRASKLLFDAYAAMDRASQETNHETKAKAYLAVEKTLEVSAAGFDKAEQPGKRDQVLRLLEGAKRERAFAVSLTELLHAPVVASSTASFASPTPTYEQPVGLERFEHADIQANLIAPKKDLKIDEDLILEIELVNAGRGPAQLIKMQDLVPEGFTLRAEPEGYRMENSYLNLKGKRLDPLKTEEINLVLKPSRRGQFAVKPRILYLDEGGKYKSHEPEPMKVTVGVEPTTPADQILHLDSREAAEARSLLAGLNVVTLSHYRIVGNYVRYGGAVCNALKDARQKIVAACRSSSSKRENYIIWAPPGSGKTYFVQEVAALLGESVHYSELNLAKLDETGFRSRLEDLRNAQVPCLCLVDEVDARPEEPWPYEVLMPFLDASATEGARFIFVLAGSSGSSVEEMKKAIASRPKGSDILSRVPTDNEYSIPPMGVGDRLLVVLSQFRQAGKQMGHDVREVEKLGLYYVALNPRLSNARQLREFAVRCAERVLPSDDRLKYDSLFHPGDRENKLFWTQAMQSASALVDSFLLVED